MPALPSCDLQTDSILQSEEGQNGDVNGEIHSEITKGQIINKMVGAENTTSEKAIVENGNSKETGAERRRNVSENSSENLSEPEEELGGLESLLGGLDLNQEKKNEAKLEEAIVISFESLKIVRSKDNVELEVEKEEQKNEEEDKADVKKVKKINRKKSEELSEKNETEKAEEENLKENGCPENESAEKGQNEKFFKEQLTETCEQPEEEITGQEKQEIKQVIQNREELQKKEVKKDKSSSEIKRDERTEGDSCKVEAGDPVVNDQGLDPALDKDHQDTCPCRKENEYRLVGHAPTDGVPTGTVSRGRRIIGEFNWSNEHMAYAVQPSQPKEIQLSLNRKRGADDDYQPVKYMLPNRGPVESDETTDITNNLPVLADLPVSVADINRHENIHISSSLFSGGSMEASLELVDISSGEFRHLLEGFEPECENVPPCQYPQGAVYDKGLASQQPYNPLQSCPPCRTTTPPQMVPAAGLHPPSPYSAGYNPAPRSPLSPGTQANQCPLTHDDHSTITQASFQQGAPQHKLPTLLGTLTKTNQPMTSQNATYASMFPAISQSASLTQNAANLYRGTCMASQEGGYHGGSVPLHHPPSPQQSTTSVHKVHSSQQPIQSPRSMPSPQYSMASPQHPVPSPNREGQVPSPYMPQMSPSSSMGSVPSPQQPVGSSYLSQMSPGCSVGSVPSPQQAVGSPQGPEGGFRPPSFTETDFNQPMEGPPSVSCSDTSQATLEADLDEFAKDLSPENIETLHDLLDIISNDSASRSPHHSGSETGERGQTPPGTQPGAFQPVGPTLGQGFPSTYQPGSSPQQGQVQGVFFPPQDHPGSTPPQGQPGGGFSSAQGLPGTTQPQGQPGGGFSSAQGLPETTPPQGQPRGGFSSAQGLPGTTPPQGQPRGGFSSAQGLPGTTQPQGQPRGGFSSAQCQSQTDSFLATGHLQQETVPHRGQYPAGASPPHQPQADNCVPPGQLPPVSVAHRGQHQAGPGQGQPQNGIYHVPGQLPPVTVSQNRSSPPQLPSGLGLCPEAPSQYTGLPVTQGRVLPSPKSCPTHSAPNQTPSMFLPCNPSGVVTVAPTTLMSGRIVSTATVVPVTAPVTMVNTGGTMTNMVAPGLPPTAMVSVAPPAVIPVTNGPATFTVIQFVAPRVEKKKTPVPIRPKPPKGGTDKGIKTSMDTTATGQALPSSAVDVKPSIAALNGGMMNNGRYNQSFNAIGQSIQSCVVPQQQGPQYRSQTGRQFGAQPTGGQYRHQPQAEAPHLLHGGDDHTSKKIRLKASRYVAGLSRDQLLYRDEDKDTLLHIFIVRGEYFLTEAIIARLVRENLIGQMINCTNNLSQTPVYMATAMNQWEVVSKLIHYGADVNMEASIPSRLESGYQQRCPVHYAAAKGDPYLKTMEMLLCAPQMEVNRTNSDGQTALNIAIQVHGQMNKDVQLPIDSMKIMRLLVHYGADLNKGDNKSGKTPVHYAIEKKDLQLLQFIFDLAGPTLLPTLLRACTFDGNTSLHFAVGLQVSEEKQALICQKLMNGGADPTIANLAKQMPKNLCKYPRVSDILQGKHHTTGKKTTYGNKLLI